MKNILFLVLVTLSGGAKAEEQFEWDFSPGLGYSSYHGPIIGLNSSLSYSLSPRWQLKLGGEIENKLKTYETRLRTKMGFDYNFSDERANAVYLGGGLGYGSLHGMFSPKSQFDDQKIFAYMEIGKRFSLNKSGTFVWKPNVSIMANSFTGGLMTITPANFSWSF